MEPVGAVLLCTRLFRQGLVWVKTVVTDDDSTTRAALHHSLQDKLEVGIIKNKKLDWPRINNRLAPDNGKLPLDVPVPVHFLADPSHRKKCYDKNLYKMAKDTKIKGFTKNDAQNLKENFGYAQSQHIDDDDATFFKRFEASIEHVYNKHDNCDSHWCKYHNNQLLTETEGKKKFKDVRFPSYKTIRAEHNKLTTKEKLAQIHHRFNSQKNESMNRSVAKFAPKNITYSKTMALKGRVAFVVAVEAIGYEKTVERLFNLLQMEFPYSIRLTWKELDKRKQFKKSYDRLPQIKKRRTRMARETMKKQRLEENQSKKEGYNYESGIGLFDDDYCQDGVQQETNILTGGAVDEVVNNEKKVQRCICGSDTHKRSNSRLCIRNKKNKSTEQSVQNDTVVGDER